GIVPQDERKVSDLLDSVKQGSADALDESASSALGAPPNEYEANPQALSPPPIILGKDMADQLGAPVGSLVTVTSPQGELTPFGIVPKYKRFKVAGVFVSGFYDYDSNWAFIRLSDAQKLFDLGDVISVLEFKVRHLPSAGDRSEAGSRCRQGLHVHELDGAEPRPFSCLAPGARGHVHYHRTDRFCRRAEHSNLPDHDGDGENARHRRAGVDGGKEAANPTHLYISGPPDRGSWDHAGPRCWLFTFVDRGPLSLGLAFRRGVLH